MAIWRGPIRRSQPQQSVQIRPAFIPDLLWMPCLGTTAIGRRGPIVATTSSSAFSIAQVGPTRKGNGSSTLLNFPFTAVSSQYPMVIAGSFVARTASPASAASAVGLGDGATTTTALYAGVGLYTTSSTIDSWARMASGGSDAALNGPTASVGSVYNVIRIDRGTTDHTMFVNGVKYTGVTATGTASNTWGNFSIGAAVRLTTPLFYSDADVAMGFFSIGRDPGDDWARAWSLNPWSMFEPLSRNVGVFVSGGATVPYWAFTGNNSMIGAGVH